MARCQKGNPGWTGWREADMMGVVSHESLPIVDLTQHAKVGAVHRACTNSGFFYVVRHGIDPLSTGFQEPARLQTLASSDFLAIREPTRKDGDP